MRIDGNVSASWSSAGRPSGTKVAARGEVRSAGDSAGLRSGASGVSPERQPLPVDAAAPLSASMDDATGLGAAVRGTVSMDGLDSHTARALSTYAMTAGFSESAFSSARGEWVGLDLYA